MTTIDIKFLTLHNNCRGLKKGLLTKTKTVSISNYVAVKKAQPIKVIAPKPGNMSSISRTHTVGIKNWRPKLSPGLTHMLCVHAHSIQMWMTPLNFYIYIVFSKTQEELHWRRKCSPLSAQTTNDSEQSSVLQLRACPFIVRILETPFLRGTMCFQRRKSIPCYFLT